MSIIDQKSNKDDINKLISEFYRYFTGDLKDVIAYWLNHNIITSKDVYECQPLLKKYSRDYIYKKFIHPVNQARRVK